MTKIKKAMVFPPMAFRMIFFWFYPFLKTTGAGSDPGKRRARHNMSIRQSGLFFSEVTVISGNLF